jgi:cyclase
MTDKCRYFSSTKWYDMRNIRLIARLDIKLNWLIKGVQMEGWRKVGDPAAFARKYAENGADELLFTDVVASLYGRNNLHDIVEHVASQVFIPMTVGGGSRCVDDVKNLLARGADKVSLTTAATQNPDLISEIAERFGSQATVVSIEAAKINGQWQAMTDNGRNHTGLNVIEWASEVERKGAGEIVLTSIDFEGRGKGFDVELIEAVTNQVSIPVVACGGLGTKNHLEELILKTRVSGVGVAQALHWEKLSISDLRDVCRSKGCFVRELDSE